MAAPQARYEILATDKSKLALDSVRRNLGSVDRQFQAVRATATRVAGAPVNVYVTTRTEKPMAVKQERRGRDIYISLQEQLAGDIARGSPISKALESKYGLGRKTS